MLLYHNIIYYNVHLDARLTRFAQFGGYFAPHVIFKSVVLVPVVCAVVQYAIRLDVFDQTDVLLVPKTRYPRHVKFGNGGSWLLTAIRVRLVGRSRAAIHVLPGGRFGGVSCADPTTVWRGGSAAVIRDDGDCAHGTREDDTASIGRQLRRVGAITRATPPFINVTC